ncbi:MAG: tRNA-dihydrouridine synthase family protein [Thermodesulfobacteriota bacterium]|nr:tRNA-dihydrouridine synthase family protein [Thermodesulfobacteriota bacterium]
MITQKLYMAPLKGFTDHLFRSTFAAHFGGFDLAVAPFISSKKDRKTKERYVKDVLPENNARLRVIPQILSKSPEDFVYLANYLYDLGHETVNWNLGCPYPTVAKKGRGAGMLPHTESICTFLDHAIPALKPALSIKTRLGWQTGDDLFRLVPYLNRYPLKELIIHPRTGIQRYDGAVDLDAVERLMAVVKIPLVYNGDIRRLEDFQLLSRRFSGINRWMIGRGCLADPFLPGNIKTGKTERIDGILKIKRFHDAMFDAYCAALDGPAHVLNKMKGLWGYFEQMFEACSKTMKKIRKTRNTDNYRELVAGFFESEAVLKKADGLTLS